MKRPQLDVFEAEALAELERVSKREVLLEVLGVAWGGDGIYQFVTPAGWTFAVFNDAGEWDYLEWVSAPDGRLWEFMDGWKVKTEDESLILQDWQPPDEALWEDAPVRRTPFVRAKDRSS